MSLQYKRAIANKIAKSVSNLRDEVSNLGSLEKKISQVVKVQRVHKNSSGYPQFSVSVSDLARSIERPLQTEDLTDENIISTTADNNLYFKIDPCLFAKDVLSTIRTQKSKYGYLDNDGWKHHVCVEFSSPNIAKPFHVGHLRSTIIGHTICNLYEASGHDVKRVNFLGDWGTQFGLLSLGLRKFSSEEKWKADPLNEFFKSYVEINKQVKEESKSQPESTSPTYQEGLTLFAQLEKGDPELLSMWKEVKRLSLTELDKMYKRLGVHFTHTTPESQFKNSTEEVLQCLRNSMLLQYDENGVGYVELDNQKQNGKASVVKSDGSSLYLTRDIAAALNRQKRYSIDRMHYVVEMGQRSHFSKLVGILHQLGMTWASRPLDEIHTRFGRVKGMSTREGNVVYLSELLDEAKGRISESMESRSSTKVTSDLQSVAEILAVTAIVLQDLKANRANDYTFSWERMLSFKSDSGVFVQYCHARLCSVLRNCGVSVVDDIDVEALRDDDTLHPVILQLALYPDIYNLSLSTLEPHHIVQYMFRLCHLVNAAYSACPVKGENNDVAQARLLVFECARQVLANCLKLLGSRPLVRM